MNKVGIVGNFGSNNISNGQIVKTKIVSRELEKKYGEDEIVTVNTDLRKTHPFKLLVSCIKLVFQNENILILPAQNGLKVFARLFSILCKILRKQLHYCVIGGWLPDFISENTYMLKYLKRFNAIYVETKTMKKKLFNIGLNNVYYMPNFKVIDLVSEREMPNNFSIPYKLCTFSRVKKEKGIIDAINAVNNINKKYGKKIYTLDIYGTIEDEFKQELYCMLSKYDCSIKYKGLVKYDKSTKVLKNYFALIFPTYYEGEGFPGTVIDAFSSGVPVIATDWKYNREIISNGKTGYIYNIHDDKEIELTNVLKDIYLSPNKITELKLNCLQEAAKYDSSIVMECMINQLEK